jgi:hypothetical protein
MERKLDAIRRSISKLEACLMSVKQDIADLITAIDAATNKIAAKIDALIAKLEAAGNAGGLTATEAQDIAASLTTEKNKLEALGADPDNPVPA